MSRSANPVPLRHRRPKICAEMEAAAATRQWSPVDVYWDPRYHSYFYAGATQPGQQEPQVGEFEVVGIDQNDPRVRPIIVTPGAGRKRKRRRISWTMGSTPTINSVSPAADDTWWFGSYWTMWIMAVLVFMLLLVLTLFLVWFWRYLNGHDDKGGLRNNAPTPSAIQWRSTTNGASREMDKQVPEEPSDEGASLALDFVTTDPHIAGKPSKIARPRHGTTEMTGSICLYIHHDEVIDSFEIMDQKSIASGSGHCDVLIRCCYVLDDDMTLRPEASRTGVTKSMSRNHDEMIGRPDVSERHSPTTLMAVRERDSAFQRLLAAGSQRARDDFARNALLLARSEGCVGLRLWWTESHESSVVDHGFVRAVGHLAAALRKASCTLGFFVPYAAAHPQPTRYAARLRLLEKVLDATASLLLYPTTSVLGNVNKWPSPSRMMGASEKTSRFAKMPSGRSLCHLLPPVAAVYVVLANASESCNVNTIQRALPKPSFLSHARMSKLCRSWHSSWNVSRHLYHSYACGFDTRGKKGLVFQTPSQALRYRRALLAGTRSTCFGFLVGKPDFPRDCYKSPLFVSER